jgi:hypothetical protein
VLHRPFEPTSAIGGAKRWVHLENYIFAYAFARFLGEGVGEELSYAILLGCSYISWDSRRIPVLS